MGKAGSPSSASPRESILDEFMAAASERWNLASLSGDLHAFACDQLGSRFLQSCLDTAQDHDYLAAARELAPHSDSLMVDPFGNYVMQRLLDRASPEQRRSMVSAVLQHGMLLPLCRNEFGCRVVQKILEVASQDQQDTIVQLMHTQDVAALIADPHTNHVVQSLVETQPAHHTSFIVQHFVGRAVSSCFDKHALRVLRRVIE